MLRLIVKVGESLTGNPDVDKHKYRDGDIISAYTDEMVKSKWDWLLANGRIDQATYDSKIISPGVMELPVGSLDTKDHFVVAIDVNYTEAQALAITRREMIDTGTKDPLGNPIYDVGRQRAFKLDINNMKYFSNTSQTWVKFSQESLDEIKDPTVDVPVRYDKALQSTEIQQKPDL